MAEPAASFRSTRGFVTGNEGPGKELLPLRQDY